MITIRTSDTRGHGDHGWLDTRHTFSFGSWQDPRHMGFGPMRVLNEDRVAPGMGFHPHEHDNMEILSWVLEGELAHKDSLGNASTIRPGEIQRMSAGTGIEHSEFNPSREKPVHFYQIWIRPSSRGLEPGYEQVAFPAESRRGVLRLIASPDGSAGSVRVHQDARVYASVLPAGSSVTHAPGAGRRVWVQLARGTMTVNGHALKPGDAAAAIDEREITLAATGEGPEAEFLLFDLP